MLTSLLHEQGFSEKEAKVYLSCLTCGSAPASTIARNAGEKRVTVYALLKELMKRGIAQEIVRGGVQYYSVVSPNDIIALKEQKIENFKSALPEFLALTNSNIKKPKVYFYEGLEGLKNIYEDVLAWQMLPQDTLPIIGFLGSTEIDKKLEQWLTKDFMLRDPIFRSSGKKNPHVKVIIFDESTEYARLNKKIFDAIVVHDRLFDMTNEIIAYGTTKVAILMYGTHELSGLVIESPTLNICLRNMFDIIWKTHRNHKK